MKIEDILAENGRRQEELDAAEDAAIERARLQRRAWYEQAYGLFETYRAKALEKVKEYLRENLVLPNEFVSLVPVDDGTLRQGHLLTLKIEDEEFELEFSYKFEGYSPETMQVRWNGDPEPKEDLDSFPHDW